MIIAYLAPEFYPPWGGVGVYSINLIKELSKQNDLEIHVFTPKKGNDYDKKKVVEYFDNNIHLHNISFAGAGDNFTYNLFFQLAVLKKLPAYNRKFKYDLIHSANIVHMPDIFLKFKDNLGISSLATAHTTIKGQVSGFLKGNKNFFKMAPSERWSILAFPYISVLERQYLKKTSHLITVSKKFAGVLKDDYGFKGIVESIHNGIDISCFDYDRIDDPYEKFPGLEGKPPIVLYAGRLITQKGLEVFVKAISELGDIDAHFVFAGKGSRTGLFELFKKYGISKERHTFLGFIQNKDLPWLYKTSSIYVLPSYYENLPIGLLEAMSMKNACIATDVGAVDEIIEDEKDGYIINQGDSDALVRRIRFLIENDDVRKNLGIKAHKKVYEKFTSNVMANKTREFYEKVLKGS